MTPCHLRPIISRVFQPRVNGWGLKDCKGSLSLFRHGRRLYVSCERHRELVERGAVRV